MKQCDCLDVQFCLMNSVSKALCLLLGIVRFGMVHERETGAGQHSTAKNLPQPTKYCKAAGRSRTIEVRKQLTSESQWRDGILPLIGIHLPFKWYDGPNTEVKAFQLNYFAPAVDLSSYAQARNTFAGSEWPPVV